MTKNSAATLYVATANAGKLRDFATAAEQFIRIDEAGASYSLRPMPGLASIPAPDEDADSFEGNARAKAIYYSALAPGLLVLADDSGLEVDVLGGAPGVYSARYAARAAIQRGPASGEGHVDEHAKDQRNNQHLLAQLAHTRTLHGSQPDPGPPTARYRCVLAAARDGAVVTVAEGSIEGCILREPRGTGGFGYDPLFYLPSRQQTMAEIDAVTRLQLSHRGRALQALLAKLAPPEGSHDEPRPR